MTPNSKKEVEEADDLGGLGHPSDGEPDTEHRASEKRADFDFHIAPPRTSLTTNTVSAAVIMNEIVATVERFDKRPMPHTP